MTNPRTVSAEELERMMKLQDVILKAMAKRSTTDGPDKIQAAKIWGNFCTRIDPAIALRRE